MPKESLTDADYYMQTENSKPERRVLLGRFSKDDGKNSSRQAQLAQAGKRTPGPVYIGHETWIDPKRTGE